MRNRPATGRIFGITACGSAIRGYRADSASFATTEVFHIENPQHIRGLVELLIFLIEPEQQHVQRWLPGKTIAITSNEGDAMISMEVTSDFKFLEVRGDLFGTRTTVWATETEHISTDRLYCSGNSSPVKTEEEAGGTHATDVSLRISRQQGIDDEQSHKTLSDTLSSLNIRTPGADVGTADPRTSKTPPLENDVKMRTILKGTWLSTGLRFYEKRMLDMVRYGKPTKHFNPDAGTHVSENVMRFLPRALGLVCDPRLDDWKTERVPIDSATHVDWSIPLQLQFGVLVCECPLGRRLPSFYTPELGMKQYGEIFIGMMESVWLGASKGLHYRDFNGGNVMWYKLPNGKTVGFLIDWGNARIRQQPRCTVPRAMKDHESVGICHDDDRSANPLFPSLATMEGQTLRQAYEDVWAERETLSSRGQPRAENPHYNILTQQLDKLNEDAGKLLHRYIDDLQSAIYLINHYVSSMQRDVPY